MKTYIEFTSNYDDDGEYNQDIYLQVPSGRNVMTSYSKWLNGKCEEIDIIEQHSFYGWSIQLRIDGAWVWQLIQNAQPWLMMAEAMSFRIPFFNASRVDSRLFKSLELFKKFLAEDSKLTFITEYTKSEYDKKRNNNGSLTKQSSGL